MGPPPKVAWLNPRPGPALCSRPFLLALLTNVVEREFCELRPCRFSNLRNSLAVLLGRLLDSWSSLRKVLRSHHGV